MNQGNNPILIEGYDPGDLLSMIDAENEGLIFSGQPIIFRVGSAQVLGQFSIKKNSLVIELAQIDGGGEGVLSVLVSLSRKYARKKGLRKINWLVYATNCAKPNLKLRRVLERKCFVVRNIKGKGECYFKVDEI